MGPHPTTAPPGSADGSAALGGVTRDLAMAADCIVMYRRGAGSSSSGTGTPAWWWRSGPPRILAAGVVAGTVFAGAGVYLHGRLSLPHARHTPTADVVPAFLRPHRDPPSSSSRGSAVVPTTTTTTTTALPDPPPTAPSPPMGDYWDHNPPSELRPYLAAGLCGVLGGACVYMAHCRAARYVHAITLHPVSSHISVARGYFAAPVRYPLAHCYTVKSALNLMPTRAPALFVAPPPPPAHAHPPAVRLVYPLHAAGMVNAVLFDRVLYRPQSDSH